MARQIRLTRIHAINWYGYEDSLSLTGNVLLAGVTGSGKSVLMDLIQAVLLGPGGARYNLAASTDKSRKSGRTLKGYCLGDTKEEEDGVEQYMRDSGVTFIALEFTWPDGTRVETWGFRIEYGSSADTEPREQTPFVIPAALERRAWLDDKRKPLTVASFEALLTDRGGKAFKTVDEYRETIAGPSRLNFDRGVLDRLLPMAMSFTVRGKFDAFCRTYILPSESVKVDSVISSFRTLRQYERELQELSNQLAQLDVICDLSEKHATQHRDHIVYNHLAHEFALADAEDTRKAKEKSLEDLMDALKVEKSELDHLTQRIQELNRRRDSLRLLVKETPEGSLCLHFRTQKVEFERKLEKLPTNEALTSSTLPERWAAARSWLREARSQELGVARDLFEQLGWAIAHAEGGTIEEIETNLSQLEARASEVLHAVTRAAEPLVRRLGDLRRELELLRVEIGRLELGLMPFRTPLLDALVQRLPHRGERSGARHLRDLCEVIDETWRPALEIFFAEKFAVLVPSADYPQAEQIFRQLQASDLAENTGRESLIRRDRVFARDPGYHPRSLAAKLSCDDPQVRVLLNQMLGNVICVDDIVELRLHERAILPDGFSVDRSLAERRRFYDGNPYVGKDGIRQQLAAKQAKEQEFSAEYDRSAPLEEFLRVLKIRYSSTFALGSALLEQCRAAVKRSEIVSSYEEVVSGLTRIEANVPAKLLKDLEETDALLAQAAQDQSTKMRDSRAAQLPQTEEDLKTAKRREDDTRAELIQVRQRLDALPHLPHLRSARTEIEQQYPSLAMASTECKKRSQSAATAVGAHRESLLLARERLAQDHKRFRDLDPQAASNTEYEVHRKRIAEAEIDAYKKKATKAQLDWEELFREQVLEKMRAALLLVDDLLTVITGFLKNPIGNSLYRIHWRANPEFEIYHRLLEMSSMAKPGELFFAFADQKLKDAVAEFFRILLEAPDGAEAQRLLDYRNYYRYDMTEHSVGQKSRSISIDKQADKFSGGENQTPYFIAILASYLRAYRRHGKRKEPSLSLVPIDEAFSKLSGDRIQDCISALGSQDLQGVFSMSTGNIPYAYSLCDQLIVITKKETYERGRLRIRNQPANMLRGSAEELTWLERCGIAE